MLTFGRFCVTVLACASTQMSKRIISVKDSDRVFAHFAMMLRKNLKIEPDEKLSSVFHLSVEKKIQAN